MTTLRDIAEAICLEQFGSEEYYGEARCCKVGGTEGCCAADYETTAQAVLDVLDCKKSVCKALDICLANKFHEDNQRIVNEAEET
jgi:hypothetical protein